MEGVKPGIVLLSETDKHGNITFANDAFCEVSKYKREELVGQPHNIIRHPDMPKELFSRLWKDIKSGNVFRGAIKNLAKDGSHYWVNATIMPYDYKGETRYLAVRYLIPNDDDANDLFVKESANYLL